MLTDVHDFSEYHVPPRRILMHHPRHGASLENLSRDRLAELNFLDLPHPDELYAEYDGFAALVGSHVETIFLEDLLGDHEPYRLEAAANPNLIFMRDSSVTLPWAPSAFIPARPALASRAREADVVGRALEHLGMRALTRFEHDEYLEGGDLLPVTFDGKRVLLIGFGVRTTKAAAIKLALDLIPEHADAIIGLSHDPDLLHLDTGFTVLPNKVILAAAGMFGSGFLIDRDRRLSPVDPLSYAEALGCSIIRCDKADAIAHERCNLLPLGRRRYLAFDLPAELKAALEEAADVTIQLVKGTEIAKATGGVHCLTRPLYG
ncbi:arginine deiminase family protein [Labrys wisconsinensis]|uniref:arginine deiminase n=1 Tax=Labrys wisconsinensis TaxID=425677 RepID=A0ABU0JL27_9HYPH|nr:arginine deiminase family protein [Labrys wisconsinensis]MDQ0475002.1 N-dimethylarginine dimethylaminohydrolase [Labrys wisconsinensis]